MTVLFSYSLDTGVHFVGGDPQSAEFCDGPGPGMALERNSFPADAPTGPEDAGRLKDRRSSLT